MKSSLMCLVIFLSLFTFGCHFDKEQKNEPLTLTAPEVAPSLLENQGQWAERFGEFEEVSFLERYPSYKIEDKVYYVSAITSEPSKTAQGFMSGIEALSLKDDKLVKSPLVRVAEGEKLTDYALYEHFLIWVELDKDGRWHLKAKNLLTNDTWTLDELSTVDPTKQNTLPNDFSYSEGLLGYRASLDGQNEVGIKVYDLKEKSLKVLA